jgi:enediyne biosynthesis protein CalE5
MTQFNPQEFKLNQKMVWNDLSVSWEKWHGLFEAGASPMTEVMLDLGKVGDGQKIIDIGSGMGDPALQAAARVGPNGRVTAVDQSGEMLAIARCRAEKEGLSNIEFIEQDAEALVLDNKKIYDAALARWSLMFLPDPDAILRTLWEHLGFQKRLALTVWGNPEEVPVLSLGFQIVAKNLEMPAPSAEIPGPFKFANTDQLSKTLSRIGFTDIATQRHELMFTFQNAEEFSSFSWDLLPPWLKSKASNRFGADCERKLKTAIADTGAHSFQKGNSLEMICVSHSISAVKSS